MVALFETLLKVWPELLGLPVAGLLLALSYTVLSFLDPTSQGYTLDHLQGLSLVIIYMLVLNVVVLLGIRFNFPWIWKNYIQGLNLNKLQLPRAADTFNDDWKELTPYQKKCVFLKLYLGLFLIAALLMLAL